MVSEVASGAVGTEHPTVTRAYTRDVAGRTIKVSLDDRDPTPRRMAALLAPVSAAGEIATLLDAFPANQHLWHVNLLFAREAWPLLCSGNTVIWVPGYRPAHPFRLTDKTRQVIYFTLTQKM